LPADETFGAPIVEQIDGRDVEFPRLYMDFYGQLEAAVRTSRTAVATASCDAAGVVGKERAEFLRDEGRRPVTIDDVDALLFTESGFRKTLTKSLEAAGTDDAARKDILGKIDAPTAIRLARQVVGFVRAVPTAADEETVEQQGPPQARNWDAEYACIVKFVPGVVPEKLTWFQYHLCLARARAAERAVTPTE
jgi:hypothetical protein